MAHFAREQHFTMQELVQSGLVKLRDEDRPNGEFYDRFRGRVMFPICNDIGEVIAFSGRVECGGRFAHFTRRRRPHSR